MKTRMITVHSLTENRYLCGENVHNGKRISLLPLHHYILKGLYNQLFTSITGSDLFGRRIELRK